MTSEGDTGRRVGWLRVLPVEAEDVAPPVFTSDEPEVAKTENPPTEADDAKSVVRVLRVSCGRPPRVAFDPFLVSVCQPRGQADGLDERQPIHARDPISHVILSLHLATPGKAKSHWDPQVLGRFKTSDGQGLQSRNAHDQGRHRYGSSSPTLRSDAPDLVDALGRCRGHLCKPGRGNERVRVRVDHPNRLFAHNNG